MVSNPEGIEFSIRGRALRDAHGPRKEMGPDPEECLLRTVSDPSGSCPLFKSVFATQ